MKTGFRVGYVNKPVSKRYSYHGLQRDCLKQPNPGNLKEYPMIEGPEWDLVSCYYPFRLRSYIINWSWLNIIQSSDQYECTGYTNRFKRYYFIEVVWYKYPGYSGVGLINIPKGSECNNSHTYIYDDYIYFTVSDYVWYGNSNLYRQNQSGPGSRICIWRSATGEKPTYDPTD